VAAGAHAVGNGVIESSWVQVREGVQRPTQRFAVSYAGYDGVLAYDAKREQSVLFVHAENEIYHPYAPSQTWLFDGAARRWSQSPALTPPLFGGQVAFDAREGVVVLIGSPADGGTCLDSMPAQTWTWNGTTWTRLHPKTSPGQCSALDASMAYDDATHRIIMATTDYGGAKVTFQNTWVWDGTNWTHRGRGPLANATVAYDPLSRRVLAFGGIDWRVADTGAASFSYHNETSAWNGKRWVQLSAGGGPNDPPPRTLATMTFDPVVHALVLFGGATDTFVRYHLVNLNDTWRWAGNHWVQMGTETSPHTMYGASFVYDTAHHVGVLYGGGGTWLLSTVRAGGGYFLATRDGGVLTFGDAHSYRGTTRTHLNRAIVGIARTATHNGYWLAASDGRVLAFGDAHFYGSAGDIRLNRPIVGIVATPTGDGYWLVASDGGVFTFGDARFDGSAVGMHLNEPIVAMASTPSGDGYWLVAADGGIFTFGDARFDGSTGGMQLDQPIVAIASTPTGDGYRLVSRDGQVFAFGKASSFGAFTGPQPIVAIAPSPTGNGYWLITDNGVVKAFGDAQQHGGTNGHVNAPVVAGVAT